MQDVKGLFEEGEKIRIDIDRDTYMKYQYFQADEIIRKYPIRSIEMVKTRENGYCFYMKFESAPQYYEYSGVYFSSSGKPVTWNNKENFVWERDDDIYIEKGTSYRYETEQIIDNWFYYQCVF